MNQVKGHAMHRQDRKCPYAAILITEISVCDNSLGIFRQWPNDNNTYLPDTEGREVLI